MRSVILLLLINTAISLNAQNQVNYDIYLIFDSSQSNIQFFQTEIADSIQYRSFIFKKIIPKEIDWQHLYVNENGMLKKGIRGNTDDSAFYEIVFIHRSDENAVKRISKLHPINSLTYEEMNNSKFANLEDILSSATRVFVIDKAISPHTETTYSAFEVTLSFN